MLAVNQGVIREPGKWRADVRENEIVARGYDHMRMFTWNGQPVTVKRTLAKRAVEYFAAPRDVLDLGCGSIPVARRLTEMASGAGIDGSSRQIALACKNEPHAEFRRADIVSVSSQSRVSPAITASIDHPCSTCRASAISMCR